MNLRPGRLKDIMDDTKKKQAYFTCHKTVGEGRKSSDAVLGPASVCAGWLEAAEKAAQVPSIVHVAQRMGLVEYA